MCKYIPGIARKEKYQWACVPTTGSQAEDQRGVDTRSRKLEDVVTLDPYDWADASLDNGLPQRPAVKQGGSEKEHGKFHFECFELEICTSTLLCPVPAPEGVLPR
ncbi:hypothetical protein CB1_000235010 [Camelus ferus]|nr:hypothetical protein CB1_000235010 [Camelus ferus]